MLGCARDILHLPQDEEKINKKFRYRSHLAVLRLRVVVPVLEVHVVRVTDVGELTGLVDFDGAVDFNDGQGGDLGHGFLSEPELDSGVGHQDSHFFVGGIRCRLDVLGVEHGTDEVVGVGAEEPSQFGS